MTLKIEKVEIIPVKPTKGLIGFANLTINDKLFLGSIGIHKKLSGDGYRITYPTRTNGKHPFTLFHPLDPALSRYFENIIFEEANIIFN